MHQVLTQSEFIEKYGDIEMSFTSYYKFCFGFEGKTPTGEIVRISIGGNSDDIYRLEVRNGVNGTLKSMEPDNGTVYNSNDEIVCEMEYSYRW